MPDTLSTTTTPAESSIASAQSMEQAPESTPETSGQAGPPAEQPEQPARDSRLFSDLDAAERDYKALQRVYTQATQALREIGDLRTLKQEREFLSQLRNDPEFLTWAQAKLDKARTGSDDPDTQKALQIVREEAERIAEEMVSRRLAPLEAHAIAQRSHAIDARMEHEHGPDWRDANERMLAILSAGKQRGWFPESVESNFDFDFVNNLYLMAVAQDPKWVAKRHERTVTGKKEKATSAEPGTPGQMESTPKVKTMEDAARLARKQLGLG